MWLDIVNDRNEFDVARLKAVEQRIKSGNYTADDITEYTTNSKGAINTADFFGLHNNIVHLNNLLPAADRITVDSYAPTIDDQSPVFLFYNDVSALRQKYIDKYGLTDIPDVPDDHRPQYVSSKWSEWWTMEDYNTVANILIALHEAIE